MTKHREEIQRLADPSIDEEMKRKIILKPGGGGFLGGVIIRGLLRWDGSKTARKFGDDRHSRKRAPRKKKSSKSSKKKSSKKKSSKKRTSRQHSPSTSVPISSPNTSHVDVSMRANLSPISSPRIVEAPVVDWSGQNRRFELAESHPRVDERFITMRKKRSSVSEHPRFPKSRKTLLRDRLYDLKKTNRRFMDKKRMQFQPIPSKTWSSWSASLREKYRQAKRDKAQLMHNLGRENIFFSSSPFQTERIKKRLIAKSYKH